MLFIKWIIYQIARKLIEERVFSPSEGQYALIQEVYSRMEIIKNYNSKVCYGYKKSFVFVKLNAKLMLTRT